MVVTELDSLKFEHLYLWKLDMFSDYRVRGNNNPKDHFLHLKKIRVYWSWSPRARCYCGKSQISLQMLGSSPGQGQPILQKHATYARGSSQLRAYGSISLLAREPVACLALVSIVLFLIRCQKNAPGTCWKKEDWNDMINFCASADRISECSGK